MKIVALAMLSFINGCSNSSVPCTIGPAVSPPTIHVTDSATGKQICDAVVILVDVRFGDAGQFSGPAIASATPDAAPYSFDAGGLDGTARDTVSSLSSLSGGCGYYPEFAMNANDFTVQVSKKGYQAKLVSNVHTAFSEDGCEPAPGQVVSVELSPVGR